VILSCLTFELRPGSLGTLEEIFRRHRIFERAIATEGCRSLYLAGDAGNEGRAHVIGVWDDEAAYQRWLDQPGREEGSEDLHAIVAESWDPSAPGEVWRVVHTAVSSPQATTSPIAG
jgi:quinol monooxygenase YgiN